MAGFSREETEFVTGLESQMQKCIHRLASLNLTKRASEHESLVRKVQSRYRYAAYNPLIADSASSGPSPFTVIIAEEREAGVRLQADLQELVLLFNQLKRLIEAHKAKVVEDVVDDEIGGPDEAQTPTLPVKGSLKELEALEKEAESFVSGIAAERAAEAADAQPVVSKKRPAWMKGGGK